MQLTICSTGDIQTTWYDNKPKAIGLGLLTFNVPPTLHFLMRLVSCLWRLHLVSWLLHMEQVPN